MALIKIPKEMGSTPGIVDNSNATAITIDSSENLTLSGSTVVLNNAGGDAQMYFGGASGTNRMYLARSGNDSLLWNVSNGAMRFGTNNTERMRIDANGNVGIGTTSPNSYSGYTVLTLNHATSGGLIDFELNGTFQGEIYSNSADLGLGLQAVGDRSIKFLTNSVERMIIDSTGLAVHDAGTVYTGAGTAKGTIHLDPNSATNFAGNAITFGASDAGNGQTAQAGIYTRTDGTLGSEMHLSTTDSYSAGSKTGIKISNLGNVTVPRGYMSAKQPAAIARGVGTWQTSYTAAAWNDLHTLVAFTAYQNSAGSPWSNSTGRFTAPIAGYYLCSMSIYALNTASATHGGAYIHPMWARNGSTSIHGVAPYQIYGYNATAADSYAEGIGRTDIVYCAEGDYITGLVYMAGANWQLYKNYAALSFCLLSAS